MQWAVTTTFLSLEERTNKYTAVEMVTIITGRIISIFLWIFSLLKQMSFSQTEKSQYSFNKTHVIFTQGHSVSFPLMLFSDYSWLS